eukprot:930425-Prymnesium_polylepis.1
MRNEPAMAFPMDTGSKFFISTSLSETGEPATRAAGRRNRLATECSKPVATNVEMGTAIPMYRPAMSRACRKGAATLGGTRHICGRCISPAAHLRREKDCHAHEIVAEDALDQHLAEAAGAGAALRDTYRACHRRAAAAKQAR